MKAISKLSEKCQKCLHVENCDDKRMEACAVMESVKQIEIKLNISIPLTMSIAAPILRDTSAQAQIREQISEQFKNDFYKRLDCKFRR